MKQQTEKVLSFLLALVLCLSVISPAAHVSAAQVFEDESGTVPSSDTEGTEDSTDESTNPTGESTEPTDESTNPTGESTEPTDESTNPTDESTDPTEESTEPEGEKVKVTFELNGGHVYEHDEVFSIELEEGTKLNLAEPKYTARKDGHGFQGWYADAEFSGERLFEIDLAEDVTVFAKFIEMKKLDHTTNVRDIARGANGVYTGDDYSGDGLEEFIKISHPYYPASNKTLDPAGIAMDKAQSDPTYLQHQYEVYADGLVDYLGRVDGGTEMPKEGEKVNTDAYVGVPFETVVKNNLDKELKAIGQGDRGMSYSWSGQGYGDWMYVTLQFNPAGQTNQMLQVDTNKEKNFKTYGGDSFMYENDYGVSGCALTKINVKTGEVKILMARALNNLDAQFRNSVEFNGKLYFCGGVNHLPSIYEIDPETDAFQCVYQDESVLTYPGGALAALKAARDKKICPTIRGLTKFELGEQKFLVISCVGMDGNPYIAVSDAPSSGHFTKIAYNYKPGTALEDQNKPENKGELLGYAAYKIPDSIFGGSIWEMAQVGNKLYAAICTGTPDNAEYENDDKENGELLAMQSFALMEGTLAEGGKVDDPAAWTWKPIAGDKEADGAPYTFGFDPERTRAGACNLLTFTTPDGQEYLYIGEYNDNQLAFKNMSDKKFEFLNRNVDQSISMYRLNPETGVVELVMGTPTELFKPISGNDGDEYIQRDVSGFGRQENQYFWQSKVFNGKMYWGTIDVTQILNPVGKRISEEMNKSSDKLSDDIAAVEEEAEAAVEVSTFAEGENVYQDILDARDFYEARKDVNTMAAYAAEHNDPFIPLPEDIFDEAPMIEVDSVDTLYMALLAVNDLMKGNDEWSNRENLQAQVRMFVQMDEIESYVDNTDDEIPASLMNAVRTVRYEHQEIAGMKELLEYMKGAIEGFDLFVSEDGVNFKAVTRTGMGDPYNNGLRVFATNAKAGNDADAAANNPWMTIGSANSFYGTQIWRMEAENLKNNAITSEKQYVEVRFIDENGERVKHTTDNDTAKAEIICTDKDAKTIPHAAVVNLYPDGAMMKDDVPETLKIQQDDAGNYIEVPVIKAFTLQLAVNGGHRIPNVKVPAGETIDLTEKEFTPVKDGFEFNGWYTTKDFEDGTNVTEIVMDAHKTVYAKWTAEETVEPTDPTEPETEPTVPETTEPETEPTVPETEPTVPETTEPETEPTVPETEPTEPEPTEPEKLECFFDDFSDTKAEWYHEAVDFMVSKGLMAGLPGGKFGPNDGMTRAMMVTVLYSQANKPAVEEASTFVDVPADMWFSDPIAWAQDTGIVSGVSADHFAPNANITREQIATILWRDAGSPAATASLAKFADEGRISSYAVPALKWAVENGIMAGDDLGLLNPTKTATRAEVAVMMMRYLDGSYICTNR